MGRSARWHDPDVLAELRMQELAERGRAFTVLAAGAVVGPAPALVALWRAVVVLRRR